MNRPDIEKLRKQLRSVARVEVPVTVALALDTTSDLIKYVEYLEDFIEKFDGITTKMQKKIDDIVLAVRDVRAIAEIAARQRGKA